ncbi:hypothetical protein S7S_16745 [Isoalcanivorax pacificus W11-5]|jgi:hypothetical protein|uniref:Uncharacterized protein n=1 Tax=Isoalcanivorax pacificus W11-5 TaxID=391936 RepID=A0A0B4XRD7_9GAMM|nr:hypothetical protein [Isoalcanivorax pacificus]AJD49761.1 hypothetical protein S7S_16745 [Isoalcanivorax pacificus W11-5]
MSWLSWGATLAGGAAAFFYLGVPFLVRGSQWLPAQYRFQPLPFDDYIGLQTATHQQHVSLLRERGFEVVTFLSPTLMVDAAVTLLRHPVRHSLCSVATLSNAQSVLDYVELVRSWDNGAMLVMNNSTVPNPFPEDPARLQCRLPGTSPDQLYDLFDMTERYLTRARGLTARDVPKDQVSEFVAGYLQHEAERMTTLGYFAAPVQGRRPCTIKGACLMTWQALWPFKGWIAYRHRTAVNQLLALARADVGLP